jgi:hypothetical protein
MYLSPWASIWLVPTAISAQQASDLYITDGTTDDWAYGTQKIFMWTFEMGWNTFYPPGSAIPDI